MLGSFRSAAQPASRRRLTVLDLPTRDRAVLRILLRAKVATTAQFTQLVYHRRQTAQLRLMRLWQAGFLERTSLPPITRGGAPLVFRLSRRGRARLGYAPLRRAEAGMQLRHDLHVLDSVCALARRDPRAPDGYPLAAWCTPAMSARFIDGVVPDALLALQLERGSAVLALEVDEGTEHTPVIRAKLARYAEALNAREGWHLVFVVGEAERGRWIARLVRRTDGLAGLGDRAWVGSSEDLRHLGLDAPVAPLTRVGQRETFAGLYRRALPRLSTVPVGSEGWLRIMGSGAGEELAEIYRVRNDC